MATLIDSPDFVDVVSWLSGRNYRQYHATTVALRSTNTGSWFFETPEFKNWLAAEHGTLWIIGMREYLLLAASGHKLTAP